ncbi:MAG: FG-GAP repeat domain-containing protein, partial [Marinirhabdus sp.]
MKTLLLFLSCSLLATTVFAQGVTFTATSMNTPGTQRAIVDMDSDGLDDIVSVSQTNINIHYQLLAGGFNSVDITTTPADYLPSWSLAAADYDGNGYTDLLYGSGSGVTFMRASDDGTAFTEISGPEYVFSQRSNFVDINNDGHLDAFVCHDVEPNVYYLNDGTGNLTFHQGGLGDYPSGGNYGSVWVDYNNDGNIDLFIAKCGGSAARRQNELFMGNGDGTFTDMSTHSNLADSMQTWSSAWGDYDNDGDLDAFVGASSFSDGFHRLMRNNGDGSFTDVINASGLTGFSSTGIENTPADVNNDGFLDIISNGHVLYGAGDLTFPTVNLNVLSSDTG